LNNNPFISSKTDNSIVKTADDTLGSRTISAIPVVVVDDRGRMRDIPHDANPFSKFLKTSGGSMDMIVDGSSTPVEFFFKPEINEILYLAAISLHIQDKSVTADAYGGLAALNNGSTLQIKKDAILLFDFLDGDPFKNNGDLNKHGADVNPSFSGAGVSGFAGATINTRFINDRHTIIDGTNGERIHFTINDALAGLDAHTVKISGGLVTLDAIAAA